MAACKSRILVVFWCLRARNCLTPPSFAATPRIIYMFRDLLSNISRTSPFSPSRARVAEVAACWSLLLLLLSMFDGIAAQIHLGVERKNRGTRIALILNNYANRGCYKYCPIKMPIKSVSLILTINNCFRKWSSVVFRPGWLAGWLAHGLARSNSFSLLYCTRVVCHSHTHTQSHTLMMTKEDNTEPAS